MPLPTPPSLLHRRFLLAALLLSAAACVAADPPAPAPAGRINVLFLAADGLRGDMVHALGNKLAVTPNLDALVKEGAVFTRAISADAGEEAARAEILTGRTSFQNGMAASGQLKPGMTLWPEAMRAAGYRTGHVGQWRLGGAPSDHGFDETRRVTGRTTEDLLTFVEDGIKRSGFSSELFADAAIELLRRPAERPFFLHVNFTTPHAPADFPPKWRERYAHLDIPLPRDFLAFRPFDSGQLETPDEKLLPYPRDAEEVRAELRKHYAAVSHLDEQVGRILEALRQSGQAERTLVIFASDGGMALGSHGFLGKQNLYEHGIGAPVLMRGPGIPAGRRIEAQCCLRDLYPTTCELAGVNVPEGVQGKSLTSLLRGADVGPYPFTVGYCRNGQRMIRTDRWKLIHYAEGDQIQLFDLLNDPNENWNLALRKERGGKIPELLQLLRRWQEENGDPLAGRSLAAPAVIEPRNPPRRKDLELIPSFSQPNPARK